MKRAGDDVSEVTMLSPGVRLGETPEIHKFEAHHFEELCRDIFACEPDINGCNIYGKQGQSQSGIDLLAHRKEDLSIEVGQCKCYEKFTPKDIRDASDVFFRHLDHWRKKSVHRFTLFVACDLPRTQCQEEILKQKKRFDEIGIIYEVWSACQIINKLRPHPGIVTQHFPLQRSWVEQICGLPNFTNLTASGDLQSTILVIDGSSVITQSSALSAVAKTIERDLANNRKLHRSGMSPAAMEWVKDIREDEATWTVLPKILQAKIIRFEVGLILDTTRDTAVAKKLLTEARTYDSVPDDKRLDALITYFESGPEAALSLLKGLDGADITNLKASMLIEIGKVDEALQLLGDDETEQDQHG